MKLKLLVLAALALIAVTGNAQAPTPQGSPEPVVENINVDGRQLVVTCQGEGQPTVVLEAGFGDHAGVWTSLVRSSIAAFSRVCAYSRADLGSSDPAPEKRDIQDVVNDLRAILVDGFIKGPVVLVGHSIGGLIINMYAHQHPKQIAGLMFIDSSHPNQKNRIEKVLPPALVAASSAYSSKQQTSPPETWNVEAAITQGETSFMQPGSLGDKPVVVLSADPTLVDENSVAWTKKNVWSGYNEGILRAENRLWTRLQKELAALSRNTRHTMVKGSTHYIQFDNPKAVIASIQQVVDAVRTGTPLAQ